MADKYDKLWRGKSLIFVLIVLLLSTVPGFATCLTAPAMYKLLEDGRMVVIYKDNSVNQVI